MEINSVNYAAAANATGPTRGKSTLDMSDFFTLLAAQFENQDMFNPVENTEFIAQMAQFSSLQQIQQLTQYFSKMMAVSMIGKTVTAQITDAVGKVAEITGTVQSLEISGGKSMLRIGNYLVDPDRVMSVTA